MLITAMTIRVRGNFIATASFLRRLNERNLCCGSPPRVDRESIHYAIPSGPLEHLSSAVAYVVSSCCPAITGSTLLGSRSEQEAEPFQSLPSVSMLSMRLGEIKSILRAMPRPSRGHHDRNLHTDQAPCLDVVPPIQRCPQATVSNAYVRLHQIVPADDPRLPRISFSSARRLAVIQQSKRSSEGSRTICRRRSLSYGTWAHSLHHNMGLRI